MTQPPPTPNDSTPIWDLVIEDMRARDNLGRQRYGTPLQAHNGRDALTDAYQEALDLCVYLRQEIEEQTVALAPSYLLRLIKIEEAAKVWAAMDENPPCSVLYAVDEILEGRKP